MLGVQSSSTAGPQSRGCPVSVRIVLHAVHVALELTLSERCRLTLASLVAVLRINVDVLDNKAGFIVQLDDPPECSVYVSAQAGLACYNINAARLLINDSEFMSEATGDFTGSLWISMQSIWPMETAGGVVEGGIGFFLCFASIHIAQGPRSRRLVATSVEVMLGPVNELLRSAWQRTASLGWSKYVCRSSAVWARSSSSLLR